MICGFVMKREYSGQLKSLIVTKSKTFIEGVDQLYGNLNKIKPYIQYNTQTFHKLKSLNDTKWKTVLSESDKLSIFPEIFMKLDEILEGRAVFIADTIKINTLMKIYPLKDLKMTKVKIQNSIHHSRRFRYPISKYSSKFEKLYQT